MEILIQTIKQMIFLSDEDQILISTLFHRKEIKQKAHLLTEGTICRTVYFIEKGLIRYYVNQNGEEKTTYFNKEGEFVCDYASFLPGAPSQINIQALEDSVIWTINYNDLQRLYKETNQGERFGRLAIEQVYLQAIQQISSLYTDPPETRYGKFIDSYPDLSQRIAQYYIASYVGVKPQSLSRIRRRISSSH